jgi:hypothetical protein
MRQLHKIGDCYRTQHGRLFTEVQFLKFTQPRAQNDLTDRIIRKPNFQDTTTSEVVTVEPARQSAMANGGSR